MRANPLDVKDTVHALVRSSGLPLNEDELAGFVTSFPILRAGAESLYFDELRYVEAGLFFRPLSPKHEAT